MELSEEILCYIFKFLNPGAKANALITCRLWNRIINDPVEFKRMHYMPPLYFKEFELSEKWINNYSQYLKIKAQIRDEQIIKNVHIRLGFMSNQPKIDETPMCLLTTRIPSISALQDMDVEEDYIRAMLRTRLWDPNTHPFHIRSNYWSIIQSKIQTPEFLLQIVNELDWNREDVYKVLTEKCVRENQQLWNKIQWNRFIVHTKTLSEDFIENILIKELAEKFMVPINISYIISHHVVSERFIQKYFIDAKYDNRTNWYLIFKYQNVSGDFRQEFISKIQN